VAAGGSKIAVARMSTDEKLQELRALLQGLPGALLAFSGGVDSTFLARVALDELGPQRLLAVMATSALFPPAEVEEAAALAAALGLPFCQVESAALSDPAFLANGPQRCYICKKGLFQHLTELACRRGLPAVLDGTNADDSWEERPGMRALQELGVRSPLREVALTKAEIRLLSKRLGLATSDKPSFACLATRVPTGERITLDKLAVAARAEAFLRRFGFQRLRVRHHGDLARIEVPLAAAGVLLERAAEITAFFRELGFVYVTLDLSGEGGQRNESR